MSVTAGNVVCHMSSFFSTMIPTSTAETTPGWDVFGDDMESAQPVVNGIVQNRAKKMTRVCVDEYASGEDALNVTCI